MTEPNLVFSGFKQDPCSEDYVGKITDTTSGEYQVVKVPFFLAIGKQEAKDYMEKCLLEAKEILLNRLAQA